MEFGFHCSELEIDKRRLLLSQVESLVLVSIYFIIQDLFGDHFPTSNVATAPTSMAFSVNLI